MSESVQQPEVIDPSRPWITDPEQNPVRQNWFASFFDPTGESPKLHFTRGWTLLFMLQFFSIFGVGMLIFVIGLAGAGTDALSVGAAYLAAGVYLVTSLMSVVIHIRRLNHARKSPLWAILVLLPLIAAFFVTMGQVTQSRATYDEMYQSRAEFLEDPRGYREAALERQRAQRAEQAGEQSGAERRGGRPGGGERGYDPENELPSQEAFVLRPHLSSFYNMILVLSIFLVPWSLMWVARTQPKTKT